MPPSAPSADQILLNAGCANPYPDYAELRSCAPVTKLSNQSVYLVSRYSDLVSVLKQPEFYSSRVPGFLRRKDDGVLEWVDAPSSEESGQILGAEDPPRHTEQRKFLSRTFHQRVKALEPALQSYCEREVAALMTNEGEVDFMAQIARRLPIWVVGQLLGLPESDYPRLAELASHAIKLMLGTTTDRGFMQCMAAAGELQEYLYHFYATLQADAGVPDNLAGDLLSGERVGESDSATVLGMLYQLVVGGADTSASWLGSALLVALRNLEQLDPTSTAQIEPLTEEALRLETPSQGNYRRVTATTELAGVTLPEGAMVVLLWGSANRDETIYQNADQVVLNRSERQHLAFGRGIHACLGSALARMECRVLMRAIWPHLNALELLDGYEQTEWIESLFNRQLQSLRLRVKAER